MGSRKVLCLRTSCIKPLGGAMSEAEARERRIIYEIRLQGGLSKQLLSRLLEDVSVEEDASGEMILLAVVVDQAALYGLLARLRDLGGRIISLRLAPPDH
jgi:hypothetical protein